MRSLTFSVLVLTTLITLSPTESALILYSRPRQVVEPISVEPRFEKGFKLVPFLNAIKASGEVDWNVWKEWFYEQGILQTLEPKIKLQKLRL